MKLELLDVSIIDVLLVKCCCCVMILIVFELLYREQSGTIFGCKIKIPMPINLIAICLVEKETREGSTLNQKKCIIYCGASSLAAKYEFKYTVKFRK